MMIAMQEQNCGINRRLMNGLLDILLTKQFPKNKDYNPKSPDRVYCQLSQQSYLELLQFGAEFLLKYGNLGGYSGVKLSLEKTMQKLEIAEDLVTLLIHAESSQS